MLHYSLSGNTTGNALENAAYNQTVAEIQKLPVVATWARADSEKEVQNFLIIAIVVTIVTVSRQLILSIINGSSLMAIFTGDHFTDFVGAEETH